MSAETLLFWIFAGMSVVGGLMATLLPRIVHAVFSLMLAFTGISGIYVLAGADFLAITQIVVYVGGIMVMLAFGILLTGRTAATLGEKERRHRPLAVLLGGALFYALIRTITSTAQFAGGEREIGRGTTGAIGKLLVGEYVMVFEFAAILLLVALVGAAFLVRRSDV